MEVLPKRNLSDLYFDVGVPHCAFSPSHVPRIPINHSHNNNTSIPRTCRPPLSAVIKSRVWLFWRITPAREVVYLWKAAMVEVEVLVSCTVASGCIIRPESVPGLVSHTRVQQSWPVLLLSWSVVVTRASRQVHRGEPGNLCYQAVVLQGGRKVLYVE